MWSQPLDVTSLIQYWILNSNQKAILYKLITAVFNLACRGEAASDFMPPKTEGKGFPQAVFIALCFPPAKHRLHSCWYWKNRIWVCAWFSLAWLGFFFAAARPNPYECVCAFSYSDKGRVPERELASALASTQPTVCGLRGGRGTFTHPFSQGRYSPSLPIKSHFLHSMHELQPHQYIRYCGW